MAIRISKLIGFGILAWFMYAFGIRAYNVYYPLKVSNDETTMVFLTEFGISPASFRILNSARLCGKDCTYFFELSEPLEKNMFEETYCDIFIPDLIRDLYWWDNPDKLEKKCWGFQSKNTVSNILMWKKLNQNKYLLYIAEG